MFSGISVGLTKGKGKKFRKTRAKRSNGKERERFTPHYSDFEGMAWFSLAERRP